MIAPLRFAITNHKDQLAVRGGPFLVTTNWFLRSPSACGSFCRSNGVKMDYFGARGPEASRLRRLKYQLIRKFGLPKDGLGGSLSRTFRRCGKPTCHCASGKGHPIWLLTYRLNGEKRTEVIPAAAVAHLQPLVDQGHELKDAIAQLLNINAQLLSLWRIGQREKHSRQRQKLKQKTRRGKRTR